jgi:hypothetical protein
LQTIPLLSIKELSILVFKEYDGSLHTLSGKVLEAAGGSVILRSVRRNKWLSATS